MDRAIRHIGVQYPAQVLTVHDLRRFISIF
jgi:hypothetical protein